MAAPVFRCQFLHLYNIGKSYPQCPTTGGTSFRMKRKKAELLDCSILFRDAVMPSMPNSSVTPCVRQVVGCLEATWVENWTSGPPIVTCFDLSPHVFFGANKGPSFETGLFAAAAPVVQNDDALFRVTCCNM